MNQTPDATKPLDHHRPRNKANMDQPQEEFIAADSAHFEHDLDHGDELLRGTHQSCWMGGFGDD